MVELKINLEEGDGCYYTHSIDLLGCFGKADSKNEAIDAILLDFKSYSEWLLTLEGESNQKTKIKDLMNETVEFNLVQEIFNVPKKADALSTSALFDSEKGNLEEEVFDFYISVINKLLDELLRIVFQYSEEELSQELGSNGNTIINELTNHYRIKMHFISRFGERLESKFYETIKMKKEELETLSILERIVKVVQGIIAIMRYNYTKISNEIFKSNSEGDFQEEEWTMKKVLRRYIVHEREKIRAIKKLVDVLKKSKTA